jgi:hypothetical protein
MDGDVDHLHKETSSSENVSTSDKNENRDVVHVPISDNGGLWYIHASILTIGSYLFNGALMALVGPEVHVGEGNLKHIKHNGKMFWRSIMIPLIFVSTLLWDTVLHLTAPMDKDQGRPSVCPGIM